MRITPLLNKQFNSEHKDSRAEFLKQMHKESFNSMYNNILYKSLCRYIIFLFFQKENITSIFIVSR